MNYPRCRTFGHQDLDISDTPRLFTHQSPDDDAVASCFATMKYVPGMEDAVIVLVPASWNGAGMGIHDMAIDIYAGGRGIKGEKETLPNGDVIVHSCFRFLVDNYAPLEDQEALEPLVKLLDYKDAYGSALRHLVPRASHEAAFILSVTGFNMNLNIFKSLYPNNPEKVMGKMFELFEGFLKLRLGEPNAESEADRAELFANGKVAYVKGKKYARTGHILFERGVRAIVYEEENDLGVLVNTKKKVTCRGGFPLTADHPHLRSAVESHGETIAENGADWFAHPGKWLMAHGTSKSHATWKSKVPAKDLVDVLVYLLS